MFSEENFQDREIVCSDCGQTFVFTAEEQEFYSQKGFEEPKRCKACRNAKKMQNIKKRLRFDMRYEITCSDCGTQTTVPFKPREDKPVYCSDCYKKHQQAHVTQE